MTSRIKKIQLAVFILALAFLIAVWVFMGYKETWLYIGLIPVIIPNPWWVALFEKLKKNKE